MSVIIFLSVFNYFSFEHTFQIVTVLIKYTFGYKTPVNIQRSKRVKPDVTNTPCAVLLRKQAQIFFFRSDLCILKRC